MSRVRIRTGTQVVLLEEDVRRILAVRAPLAQIVSVRRFGDRGWIVRFQGDGDSARVTAAMDGYNILDDYHLRPRIPEKYHRWTTFKILG